MLHTMQSTKRDEGFTLIELLVVVLIIGILAAIAIPAFLNQRESAWQSAVESDLRNAAIEIETVYTRDLTYPTITAAGGTLTLDNQGDDVDIEASQDVTWTATSVADGVFCISAVHDNSDDTQTEYNSDTGGINRGGACA